MIAMIRTKLQLSDKEIMKKSWIIIQLEMADFPFYDYKSETQPKVSVNDDSFLSKYKNRYNK